MPFLYLTKIKEEFFYSVFDFDRGIPIGTAMKLTPQILLLRVTNQEVLQTIAFFRVWTLVLSWEHS